MSDFVRTGEPCSRCTSSDAAALNSDGWWTCFSCEARWPDDDPLSPDRLSRPQEDVVSPSGSDLLTDVRPRPLKDRGIGLEACRKFGVGLARHRGRTVLAMPYHDAAGRLVAQKVRTPDKHFEVVGSLKEARLFGEHLWPASGKMVVITEGELDALAACQIQGLKWPAVSIPSGASGAVKAVLASLDWLEGFERIVLAFDMDEPGQKAAREVAQALPPGKAFIASLPRKDACECLKDGLGEALRSAFWNARPWRPDGILDGAEAWERAAAQEDAPSLPWGLPLLDELTGGMRSGELVIITAGTGSGKTTFVQQTIVDQLQAGVRCGLLALEAPLRRVVLDLCSTARGVERQEEMSDENRAAWDQLSPGLAIYQHFGSTEADNILARMRYLARAERCKVIVLDHLSIVVSGFGLDQDERRAIDQVLTGLATLAQETETTIIAVSHLKRPKEGAHEEGGRVTLAHLRGSGSIAQLAHTVVAVERDQQSGKPTAQLRVLKCRHTGRLGPADTVRFDAGKSRLLAGTAAEYGLETAHG